MLASCGDDDVAGDDERATEAAQAVQETSVTAIPQLPAARDMLYQADFAAWRRSRGETVPLSERDIYPMGTQEWNRVSYTDIEPWADTHTGVELRLVSETTSIATGCLLTRYVPRGYYSLCMNADGTTAAFYQEPDSNSEEVLLDSEARVEGADPSQWTTLSIIAREGDLWFLINDQLVGTATHDGPTEGGVGLYVQTDGPNAVQYEFRNLTVHALE
jgi:hypothetical protein